MSRVLALMLLLLVFPLSAEEAEPVGAVFDRDPAQPTQDQPSEPQSEAQAAEGESRSQTAPTAAAANEDDPFDYESSEQISEDLSVSFPVDI